MINLLNKNFYLLLNLAVIIFLFILPYYIFEGKIFLGGDDTRLFYSYPIEFIKNVSFFSWSNQATIGINSTTQFMLPLLSEWSLISMIIPSKVALSYLALTIPMIFGFLTMQVLVKELFKLDKKYELEIVIGSLFYIFSPILILDQYFIFLTTIWLIGLIPMTIFLFIRYLKTNNFLYPLIAGVVSLVFSAAMYSIPWSLGFILPMLIGFAFTIPFYKKREIIYFIKKFLIFFIFLGLVQSYWLLNFALSYLLRDSNSFAQKFVSEAFVDTFSPTVLATATGNIFYPLLNLFHRQISFDFVWYLSNIFSNYYDYTYIFGFIFVLIITGGLFKFKNRLNQLNQKIYIGFLLSFVFSLFFFTVNIGPLKDIFLLFGKIPGFLMFRNFYDKFSVGYIIIFTILIIINLVILKRKNKLYKLLLFLTIFAIIINFVPIKNTVNSPLWTTQNIYRVLEIPDEYLEFMGKIRKEIPSTNFILNLPFGTSIYSVIKDDDSENVYVGTSPLRIFSGHGDIAGHYSFNFTDQANTIDKFFLSEDYDSFNEILYRYNINYVMVTNNIPEEVKNAWVFDQNMLKAQDEDFLNAITSRKLFESKNGNYELYEAINKNSIFSGENIIYKKLSPVKYRIYISNIEDETSLVFNESFHEGWKLYLSNNPGNEWCETSANTDTVTECVEAFRLFQLEDLKYLFRPTSFEETQTIKDEFSNVWTLNTKHIKDKFSDDYYIVNEDGSIDLELELYFIPQNYFYYGAIITLLTLLFGVVYYVYQNKKKK